MEVPKSGTDVGMFLQNRLCTWEPESILHIRTRFWVAREAGSAEACCAVCWTHRPKQLVSRYFKMFLTENV